MRHIMMTRLRFQELFISLVVILLTLLLILTDFLRHETQVPRPRWSSENGSWLYVGRATVSMRSHFTKTVLATEAAGEEEQYMKSLQEQCRQSKVYLRNNSELMEFYDPGRKLRNTDDEIKKYFTLRSKVVNPITADFMISGDRLCKGKTPYILLVVPSMPGHFDVRDTIRNTYGSYATVNARWLGVSVKVMFIVGNGNNSENEHLRSESRLYGDVVQGRFVESYKNLTRKMLLTLRWVTLHCSGIQYMMKIDEDVFVNMPALVRFLQRELRHTNTRGSIFGHYLAQWVPVMRAGKWAVSCEDYPLKRYPPYVTGNSYIIAGHIIPRMSAVSEYLPHMNIEDAFLTGVLSYVTGVTVTNVNKFARWKDPPPVPCQFIGSNTVSATKVSKRLMQKLWLVSHHYREICHKQT